MSLFPNLRRARELSQPRAGAHRARNRNLRPRRLRSWWIRAPVLASALLATLSTAGCDNPACVFGGNCNDSDGGGLGANPASLPNEHEWLLTGAPSVADFAPSGAQVPTTTAIAITFSESMALQSLQSGVLLVRSAGLGQPVATLPPALVGDGRVLVLIPASRLGAGTAYDVRFADDAVVTDLQGTALVQPSDGIIGRFTVAAADPAVPSVIATWPPDLAQDQSATGEIVVVFDRKMNASTVTTDSFAVTADGATPAFNPTPQPIFLIGPGSFPVSDTRVFRYRSVDAEGEAASLGTSAQVVVTLSPAGDKVLAESGGVLAATSFDYDVAGFAAPLSAEIVSLPMDAIGIDDLDGTRPLEVAVELEDGQSGDRLGVFVFGTGTSADLRRIALFRDALLGDVPFDPVTGIATLGEAQLDLASSVSPVTGRFADGEITLAFRVQRGGVFSPVRLLDVDAQAGGPQSPELDTVRPTLTGFGTSGTDQTSFVSDVRDVTIVGRASERLRSVEVTTALGNNGVLTPVVGSSSSGLFIAAPVPAGVLDPAQMPLAFTATIYDRALNQALATATAAFRQVGASGPGAALPGNPTVEVEVFDARTLAAISGALVFTHEDAGGSVTALDADATAPSGKATLDAAAAGETIVTIDAAGYDLFTFHGVPTARVSIPLARSLPAATFVQGTVSTGDSTLPTLERFVADPRTLAQDEPFVTVQSCSFNPATLRFDCGFGPRPIVAGPVGATGFVGADTPLSEFNYVAQTFLRAYDLELPVAPAQPGQTSNVTLTVDTLLDAPGIDQEERTLDGPATVLSAVGIAGFDLANQDGAPRIDVQGQVPGLRDHALAGFGVAFDLVLPPVDQWSVRCAIPGRADPTAGKYPGDEIGELALETFAPNLFLRCELRDDLGDRTGRRPRFPTPGLPPTLFAPDVPLVLSPPPGGNSGGPSFDLVFDDVLDAGIGLPGLYRATLAGVSGRRWTLVRADGGAATQTIHVPDIGAAGGLPNGAVGCTIEAFAWPGFDPALLAWTDVEREHDAFAQSAPISFTQP